jgi:hypothetical protein
MVRRMEFSFRLGYHEGRFMLGPYIIAAWVMFAARRVVASRNSCVDALSDQSIQWGAGSEFLNASADLLFDERQY